MIGRRGAIAAMVLAVSACHQAADQHQSDANGAAPVEAPRNEPAPAIPPPQTGPDARTPLAEPKGAIDPKSVEAAGQLVQRFGALVEQARYAEAERLWGSPDTAAAFLKELPPNTHLEIGDLGAAEGAAGSIYATIPVVFYRDSSRRLAEIILRRVNDVPGSTEAQRRWHIERIDWKSG